MNKKLPIDFVNHYSHEQIALPWWLIGLTAVMALLFLILMYVVLVLI